MKKSLLTLALIASSISICFAWGRSGHRIIGHLAENQLNDKAKTEVKRILGDESLSDASTWVDDVLNDDRYKNLDNWHYAKKDIELPDNAVHQYDHFVEVLKNKDASAKDRVLALRVIAHIVGDMHNPIHCAYMKDQAGHKVKMVWKHPHSKTNLHKVWDTDMIKMRMLDDDHYAQQLESNLSNYDYKKWQNMDANVWVKESQTYLDQVYDFKHSHIDKDYYNQNITIVDMRMTQAGVRLAYVLNQILGT